VLVDDGHAEDGAGEITCFLVEGRIEAQVGVGVGNVDGLARGEHRAGDAEVVGQADLHRLQALADFRPQFAGLFVVEEQRRALGIEQPRRLAHDLLQQRAQLDVGSDLGNDIDELHFLASNSLHALDELCALQGQRALAGHGLEQVEVLLGESSGAFVERLRDADDLALHCLDRHAKDVARGEAGLLVDRTVEAVVGVGIMDDQRSPAVYT
jgi:hypothetical protein